MMQRFSVQLLFLSCCGSAILGLGAGCAGDSSPISVPDVVTVSPYVTGGARNADVHMALLSEDATIEDAQLIAHTGQMELLSFKESSGLAVFSGFDGELEPMIHSPLIETFEAVRPADATDPVDLYMVFMEGDWDGEAVEGQRGLDELHFRTVHDHAQGSGIRVATLDTGAFFPHPHLAGRMIDIPVPGLDPANETKNGRDDDQDGLVDEGFGHGTHVAGLILTCAPAARVWPIKVLNDDGAGTTMSIALGLDAILKHGADIVNMSFRVGAASPTLDRLFQKLEAAGIVLMAAAGNNGGAPVYPASSPYTVAVAATGPPPYVDPDNPLDPNDPYDPSFDDPAAWSTLAEYSAYGSEVHIAAPGSHLVSSFPGGASQQRSASGTSMACAVASGVWACVAGPHDRPRPQEPLPRMFSVADNLTPDPSVIAHGRVSPTRCLILIPTVP